MEGGTRRKYVIFELHLFSWREVKQKLDGEGGAKKPCLSNILLLRAAN